MVWFAFLVLLDCVPLGDYVHLLFFLEGGGYWSIAFGGSLLLCASVCFWRCYVAFRVFVVGVFLLFLQCVCVVFCMLLWPCVC